MAAIVVAPVIASITAIVAVVVEKGIEAAVMASIVAAVTAAFESAVSSAIAAAIATAVASAVKEAITASTTKAVEDAVNDALNDAVKDVIHSQGVHDISQAITAIPSDEVVNKLVKAAIDAINPHLLVFQDPAFVKLTKLIKALRAVKELKKLEDDDDDDDDCDEEKYRYFRGPAASDDAEDFIFFSVFGSAECKEGDEIFSMSAQWKKLKSLIDDPIGGRYVNQLFRELFDNSADEEEETDISLVASVQSLAVDAPGRYVNQLFRELFDSSADEEEETDISLVASVQSLAVDAPGRYVNQLFREPFDSSADEEEETVIVASVQSLAVDAPGRYVNQLFREHFDSSADEEEETDFSLVASVQSLAVDAPGRYVNQLFQEPFDSSADEEEETVIVASVQSLAVDAPGRYVNQLFREHFDSSADEEEETDFSLVASVQSLAVDAPGVPKIKYVKVSYGVLVDFPEKEIFNIKGSSVDKRKPNWLEAYFKLGYGECGKCYIESEDPKCGHTKPLKGNIVGGHVWSPELKKADQGAFFYILPICKRHNKPGTYDNRRPDGSGWLKTTQDARAMQITSTDKVPGWPGKYQALMGTKGLLLLATEVDGEAGECHENTQPKHLSDLLVEEVHKIALEFAKDPIDIVFKEVSGIVLGKLNEIIKQAGNDAENWAKSDGYDVMLQSLISFYGKYQAVERLTSLQSDAIGRFHSGAQSALTKYKNECFGQAEQARRKQRPNEETDKVIASKKWQDRIVAFEETVAFKVSTLVTP